MVDDNPKVKWCTGAGCENGVLCERAGEGAVDVHCSCGASFCWNCQEDAHRPVDCETVRKWLVSTHCIHGVYTVSAQCLHSV